MMEQHIRIQRFLSDIYTSSERILIVLENVAEDEFTSDHCINTQDIVARRLTIIGEASAALLRKHSDFCDKHREIPLKQARGMRNVLVHEYNDIDWLAVWNDCHRELPLLIAMIEPLLTEGKVEKRK